MSSLEYQKEALEQFNKDCQKLKMTIVEDDGIWRHLSFSDPASYCNHFDIVTFPGTLLITGDMGTFSFSRIHDMFEFFRFNEKDERYRINPSYWAEKLTSVDKSSVGSNRFGYEEFSEELFRKNVAEWIKQRLDDEEHEIPKEFQEEINDIISANIDDGEISVTRAIMDYQFEFHDKHGDLHKINFWDFYETNNRTYTFHYLWICYAIVWAIEQYDKVKLHDESE